MRRDARGRARRPYLLSYCDHLCFCQNQLSPFARVPSRQSRKGASRPGQALASAFASPPRLAKPAAEVIQLVEAPESDADLAALAAMPDRHFRAKLEGELILERLRVGVDGRVPLARPRALAGILAQALDVPDRQPLGDDAVGERVRVGNREQRAGVAGRNLAAREQSSGYVRADGSGVWCWRHGCGSC